MTNRTLIIASLSVLLGALLLGAVFSAISPPEPQVVFETLEDSFIDIDGDGDLDYVHFVQFIRQENEEADPYPAPQPGQ